MSMGVGNEQVAYLIVITHQWWSVNDKQAEYDIFCWSGKNQLVVVHTRYLLLSTIQASPRR